MFLFFLTHDGRHRKILTRCPQIFPFVALQFYEESDTTSKDIVTIFLVGSFVLWLTLNVVFFCTIDLSYMSTFFGTLTGPQYSAESFKNGEEDCQKFDATFDNRPSDYKSIQEEVKVWVAENIARWQLEKPEWFKIEKIPDYYLPAETLIEAGGARRRRSSVSLREIVGGGGGPTRATGNNGDERRVHPIQ